MVSPKKGSSPTTLFTPKKDLDLANPPWKFTLCFGAVWWCLVDVHGAGKLVGKYTGPNGCYGWLKKSHQIAPVAGKPSGMYKTLKMMGQTTYRLVQDFSHQQYVKQQIQVDGIWLSTNAEAVTSNSKQGLLDRKDLTKQVARRNWTDHSRFS